MDAFVAAYEQLGYEECGSTDYEAGVEKVVIYADSGVVRHAARQIASGEWTSKLGRAHDIVHERPDHVAGPQYGHPVVVMKRDAQAEDL